MLWTYSLDDIERILKLKSVSKYGDHFSSIYSDTKVEKSAILLLKMEENGRFLEIWVLIVSQGIVLFQIVLFQCRLSNKCIELPIANCCRQLCDVIFPPKSSNSKNKKHTFCKNDMFYVHGKFCRSRMKIKEVEARDAGKSIIGGGGYSYIHVHRL
jgi:hypothetical protein